jgi:drug/metabolite transporter (DMT)-like permease
MNRSAVIYALVSAALFGASTPAAKLLIAATHPIILAGLLYCGAGIGVALIRRARDFLASGRSKSATIQRSDVPWLIGAIACGGVIGPVLLMLGLARTDAASASLLLTLETAATALLAWFLFHENFDRRIALGIGFIMAGALVLAWSGAPTAASAVGPLAILGACCVWGLDNNLTRRISLSDPLQIVEIKGLFAGPISLALGLAVGGALPPLDQALLAGIVGFLGYGLSLALFVIALRHLGAARTGAYFGTSPFLGAVVAVLALGEPLTAQLLAAGALMALGCWLHLTERHEHDHTHEPQVHTHAHVHDTHHSHRHGPADPTGEPHTHLHRHDGLKHAHPHMPDMHHQHRH